MVVGNVVVQCSIPLFAHGGLQSSYRPKKVHTAGRKFKSSKSFLKILRSETEKISNFEAQIGFGLIFELFYSVLECDCWITELSSRVDLTVKSWITNFGHPHLYGPSL